MGTPRGGALKSIFNKTQVHTAVENHCSSTKLTKGADFPFFINMGNQGWAYIRRKRTKLTGMNNNLEGKRDHTEKKKDQTWERANVNTLREVRKYMSPVKQEEAAIFFFKGFL